MRKKIAGYAGYPVYKCIKCMNIKETNNPHVTRKRAFITRKSTIITRRRITEVTPDSHA
nr:MAG TPA_asm: hypothetical protein [Bacteriophage sp.]